MNVHSSRRLILLVASAASDCRSLEVLHWSLGVESTSCIMSKCLKGPRSGMAKGWFTTLDFICVELWTATGQRLFSDTLLDQQRHDHLLRLRQRRVSSAAAASGVASAVIISTVHIAWWASILGQSSRVLWRLFSQRHMRPANVKWYEQVLM